MTATINQQKLKEKPVKLELNGPSQPAVTYCQYHI